MAKQDDADKRRDHRYAMELPVKVRRQNGESREEETRTRDISQTGVYLYSDSQPKPGSELEIVVMLPPEITNAGGAWVCCHARVVRVEGPYDDGQFGLAAVMERYALLPEV